MSFFSWYNVKMNRCSFKDAVKVGKVNNGQDTNTKYRYHRKLEEGISTSTKYC